MSKDEFIKMLQQAKEEEYRRLYVLGEYIGILETENAELKKENKQLKEKNNNRREDTILEQRQRISDLEDNWNSLKKQVINRFNKSQDIQFLDVLQDMQELEKGSDGNEKNKN